MRVKEAAVIAPLVAATAACSSGAADRSERPVPSSHPDPTVTQALTGGPVPAGLRGTWIDVRNPHITLMMTANRYRVLDPPEDVSGDVAASGAEVDFGYSAFCDLGTGRYSWSIEHGLLKLRAVAPDPCTGRATNFDGGTFRR